MSQIFTVFSSSMLWSCLYIIVFFLFLFIKFSYLFWKSFSNLGIFRYLVFTLSTGTPCCDWYIQYSSVIDFLIIVVVAFNLVFVDYFCGCMFSLLMLLLLFFGAQEQNTDSGLVSGCDVMHVINGEPSATQEVVVTSQQHLREMQQQPTQVQPPPPVTLLCLCSCFRSTLLTYTHYSTHGLSWSNHSYCILVSILKAYPFQFSLKFSGFKFKWL